MMLICGVAFPALAQTQTERAPARPEPGISVTNSFKLNRLQRLEDELTRSLKKFFGDNSVENVMTRRPPPPVRIVPNQNKDRHGQTDWMNLDSSDFSKSGNESTTDLRKILEDKDRLRNQGKPEDQLLEYYLRQDKSARNATTDRGSEEPILGNARDWLKNEERPQGPADVLETEEKLRSILREQSGSSLSGVTGPSTLSGLFTPSDTKDVTDFKKRENPYLQEYRSFMVPSATTPGNDLLGSVLASNLKSPFQQPVPVGSLPPIASPKREVLGPQFGSINPVLTPLSPLDPTISVVNQWNPYFAPAAAAPQPNRIVTPPKPTFEAPRRKF